MTNRSASSGSGPGVRSTLSFLDSPATAWVAVASMFACVALLAFSRVQDFDFFWHLANGREMWLRRRLVDRELFSYTRPGTPFSNHGWAAEVVLYLVFAATGALGTVLFKVALILLVGWFSYRAARMVGAGPVASSVLVLVAVAGGLERYRERPELFSLVLFAFTGCLLTGVATGVRKRGWLLALPVVLAIWDLLHGAVYGFLYLGVFAAGELAKRRPGAANGGPPALRRPLRMDLALVLALSIGLSLVNPFGLRTYDFFVEYLRANPMVARIAEWGWSPPALFPLFWALFAGFAALAVRFRRDGDRTRTLVAIAFFALAVRYRRAIPFATLAAVPAAATYIAAASRAVPRRVAAGIGVSVASLLVCSTVFLKFLVGDNPYSFGYEVNGLLLPKGSARYLAASPLRGHMYNPGHFGGYLAYYLYPGRRIFLYNHHVVFKDLPSAAEDPRVLDRYDVQYAVLERRWGASAKYDSIFPPDRWALVFFDDASRILVRRSPENAAFLEANALQYFSPATLFALEQYASDPAALERYESSPAVALTLAHEMASCLRHYQNRLGADYVAYLLLRHEAAVRPEAALRDIEAALESNPSSAYLWFAASRFRLRSGQVEMAREALLRATALDPKLVERLAQAVP